MTKPFLELQLKSPVPSGDTVGDDVYRQFKEELGGQVQPFNFTDYHNKVRLNINTPADDADYMVRQKFGLLPPQLTLSERNLIKSEEQRLARKRG